MDGTGTGLTAPCTRARTDECGLVQRTAAVPLVQPPPLSMDTVTEAIISLEPSAGGAIKQPHGACLHPRYALLERSLTLIDIDPMPHSKCLELVASLGSLAITLVDCRSPGRDECNVNSKVKLDLMEQSFQRIRYDAAREARV